MKNEGCSEIVMEVSSHSLVLYRVYGLNFGGGVFTNFTTDHLDFHGTIQNYLKAKKIFFDSLSKDSVCIFLKRRENHLWIFRESMIQTD